MGHEVTLVGAFTIRRSPCKASTRFFVSGGPDCEDAPPGTGCLDIAYAVTGLRKHKPSGCG